MLDLNKLSLGLEIQLYASFILQSSLHTAGPLPNLRIKVLVVMQTSVSPHVYTSPQFLFQLAREGKHFQTMTPTRIYNESHCKT